MYLYFSEINVDPAKMDKKEVERQKHYFAAHQFASKANVKNASKLFQKFLMVMANYPKLFEDNIDEEGSWCTPSVIIDATIFGGLVLRGFEDDIGKYKRTMTKKVCSYLLDLFSGERSLFWRKFSESVRSTDKKRFFKNFDIVEKNIASLRRKAERGDKLFKEENSIQYWVSECLKRKMVIKLLHNHDDFLCNNLHPLRNFFLMTLSEFGSSFTNGCERCPFKGSYYRSSSSQSSFESGQYFSSHFIDSIGCDRDGCYFMAELRKQFERNKAKSTGGFERGAFLQDIDDSQIEAYIELMREYRLYPDELYSTPSQARLQAFLDKNGRFPQRSFFWLEDALETANVLQELEKHHCLIKKQYVEDYSRVDFDKLRVGMYLWDIEQFVLKEPFTNKAFKEGIKALVTEEWYQSLSFGKKYYEGIYGEKWKDTYQPEKVFYFHKEFLAYASRCIANVRLYPFENVKQPLF